MHFDGSGTAVRRTEVRTATRDAHALVLKKPAVRPTCLPRTAERAWLRAERGLCPRPIRPFCHLRPCSSLRARTSTATVLRHRMANFDLLGFFSLFFFSLFFFATSGLHVLSKIDNDEVERMRSFLCCCRPLTRCQQHEFWRSWTKSVHRFLSCWQTQTGGLRRERFQLIPSVCTRASRWWKC